jgi:L-lactate dehydrogenase (cytochrome)
MGATGTYIGRAFVHGLGAQGQAGVTKALHVIRNELDISMAFTGRRDIKDVTRDSVLVPEGFSGTWA